MKWVRKGHQFDAIAKDLKHFQRIYIYGNGYEGKNVLEAVSFLGIEIYFVDRDKEKRLSKICGVETLSPELFQQEIENSEKTFIVVYAVSRYHYLYLSKDMMGKGYRENLDFFSSDVFLRLYLPIISVYMFDKLYIQQLSQMVTTRCSLKCRDCMMSIPYLKEKSDVSLEKLKCDADILFSKVDFIQFYGPGGGEIMLYPQLDEFLTYILKKYRQKIGTMLLITNGTVYPGEKLIKVLQEYDMSIRISNYENINGWTESKNRLVKVCRENRINCYEQKVDAWIDMDWDGNFPQTCTAQDMFEQCDMSCREFVDGIEYYCMHGRYANIARSLYDVNEEGINFMDNSVNKKMIMEYNLGYLEKGYLNICARCKGYFGINQTKIPVAEQLKEQE